MIMDQASVECNLHLNRLARPVTAGTTNAPDLGGRPASCGAPAACPRLASHSRHQTIKAGPEIKLAGWRCAEDMPDDAIPLGAVGKHLAPAVLDVVGLITGLPNTLHQRQGSFLLVQEEMLQDVEAPPAHPAVLHAQQTGPDLHFQFSGHDQSGQGSPLIENSAKSCSQPGACRALELCLRVPTALAKRQAHIKLEKSSTHTEEPPDDALGVHWSPVQRLQSHLRGTANCIKRNAFSRIRQKADARLLDMTEGVAGLANGLHRARVHSCSSWRRCASGWRGTTSASLCPACKTDFV